MTRGQDVKCLPNFRVEQGKTRMRTLTFDPSPLLEEGEEVHLIASDNQVVLMRWHCRLGHLSFMKLKLLANNGGIPRHLAKVPPPKCAGCLYGAMTKVPWHGKESKSSHKVFVAMRPGECVSVDHMVSTQQGFYTQSKGKLIIKRYRATSVFVDHFSRLQFVHLMQDLSSNKMVKAKLAFECFTTKHGVAIKHYHCNNGRFADNTFQAVVQTRTTTTHLLWSQCPLPKWYRRASDRGPVQKCPKTTATRATLVAGGSARHTMAICSLQCRPPPQWPADAQGWNVTIGAF
jgi:hypothetical protein